MVKDTILGKVDFRVAFGNDTISPLKLEYSYPASNSYIYIDEQSGTFLIKNLCFDNGLRLFDPDGLISLKQNTPNPVNETTKISFEIIENSNTQLIVIDILGNTVMELVNKVLPIGKYEVEVNANQLNTGTYNYILRTSTKTLIRNMQVIKK